MVTTSCDPVDLSELSDAVNFDIVGYEGTDEISMRYIDDSVVGQQKIKIVAYVSSKIIGDFKFWELGDLGGAEWQYIFHKEPDKVDRVAKTVTTYLTFSSTAGERNFGGKDFPKFNYGGYAKGTSYFVGKQISLKSHFVGSVLSFDSFETKNEDIIGMKSNLDDIQKKASTLQLYYGFKGIADDAFNSNSVATVSLPPSVKQIIPDSGYMEYSMTRIGARAFKGCSALVDVEMPTTVSQIGDEAFYGCDGISEIKIPIIQHIGENAFGGISSLYNPNNPNDLSSVTLDTEAENTPDYTWYTESDVTGDIGKVLHYRPTSLKTGDPLPASTKNVGGLAIGKIRIGGENGYNGNETAITSLDDYSFAECASLYSVDFHETVLAIGQHAFENCTLLENVTLRSPTLVPYSTGMLANCGQLSTIHVPEELIESYQADPEWQASGYTGFFEAV